ncbi:hypothetical protein OH460_08970 [Vibrio sp. Makdt]|uniref:hypothetical protein n=1 Tax=Vibrio sp. Makdt TaxID=2998828 RepID=UPI0022CD8D43|nr:hypothetical protein [Vibrio sp. Makdt]MDA0152433.1 hypothetical protein [Vibrio sp. Makdt]
MGQKERAEQWISKQKPMLREIERVITLLKNEAKGSDEPTLETMDTINYLKEVIGNGSSMNTSNPIASPTISIDTALSSHSDECVKALQGNEKAEAFKAMKSKFGIEIS